MNDIVDKLFFVKVSMYADDCVLYLSANNWNVIRRKIQEDLDCFERWGELNNLNLNVSKSKLLLIGSRSKLLKQVNPEPLKLYDKDVPFVKSYNYLGVILDSEMTSRPFFSHVKKIAYGKMFTLTKIRSYLTESASIMIYITYYFAIS